MTINSTVSRTIFLLVILAITLFFGLYTKEFGRTHTPYISSAGNLGFTKYSIATTEADFSPSSDVPADADGLALDINLDIAAMPEINNLFTVIFSINDTQDKSQMLLGQWQNYLIVMSGDDYANRGDQPRISIPLDSIEGYVYPQGMQIHIKATDHETTVSINDKLTLRSTDFIAPLMQGVSTVSLGNTLNRKHGWTGSIGAFDLHASFCRPKDLNEHEPPCSLAYTSGLHDTLKRPGIDPAIPEQDHGESKTSMWTLQPAYAALTTVWLSSESMRYWNTTSFKKDLLINLVGFIPITFAIFILTATRFQLPTTALITIIATIAISLLIESVQIFIPSRTSSIVDLAANSAAGILTTLVCCIAVLRSWPGTRFLRKRRKKRRRRHGVF